MDLEDNIKKTIEFLKKFGELEDPHSKPVLDESENYLAFNPDFKKHGLNNMQEMLDIMGSPYKTRYIAEREYNKTNNFKESTEDKLQKMVSGSIPNSSEFALVDIGSGLGDSQTLFFAHNHDKVDVYMIDHLSIDDIKTSGISHIFMNGILKDDVDSDDPEILLNNLIHAEGMENTTYIHRDIEYHPRTNLPELESKLEGKKVFFTGWRNNRSLGFFANDEASYHGADCIVTSLTALEYNTPGDYAFAKMSEVTKGLLSPNELSKIIHLSHDPTPRKQRKKEKYNFEHPGEKAFALGLKQLFNLTACSQLKDKGYNVEILFDHFGRNPRYNQANHFIYAYKNKDILRRS